MSGPRRQPQTQNRSYDRRTFGGRISVPLVSTVLAFALLGGCSSDPSTVAAGCNAPRHDALDPASSIHVLPGAPEPHYLEDPPTSGAHQVAVLSQFRGVLSAPISRPQQVGLLEKGQVLIQATEPLEALRPLTLDRFVTVAPAQSLPAPITATAWQWSMSCRTSGRAELRALRSFTSKHENHGPEAPPNS